MVYIVIIRVIRTHHLEGVKMEANVKNKKNKIACWTVIPAHARANPAPRESRRKPSTGRLYSAPKSVRCVNLVMDEVYFSVEKLVHVFESVEEVLPCMSMMNLSIQISQGLQMLTKIYAHIARQNCAAGIPHQYHTTGVARNAFSPTFLPSAALTTLSIIVPTFSISPLQLSGSL